MCKHLHRQCLGDTWGQHSATYIGPWTYFRYMSAERNIADLGDSGRKSIPAACRTAGSAATPNIHLRCRPLLDAHSYCSILSAFCTHMLLSRFPKHHRNRCPQ